ncbi:RNA polymerase sigma factor, RpoD/SigA family [Chamaesiphon minutus]|uniref:RNA polymerase sigma factor, cyanobacterial RpoD-like family n=1 Tax=Chamaesiphon minutus (strain ATCC 27169 / PCC 6605) TaxID=1173020 RepID=K9UFK2_CHAP6|nr:RNA polymerase sigma factor, RpoD/SigA family [Chamaesiphon minutus]AFY93428.1 RNA polymerase sigma factor, cyanobacterial RpoD-like family [Chamaesiphon minutus PCC 6605]
MPSVKTRTVAQPRSTGDMVRTYLHEIGRVPLLSHEQELCYGKQVQQMMLLKGIEESLEQTLNRPPTKTEWAQAATISEAELDRVLRQGRQAKQKMIEANLRLVVAIAKKYQKRNLEFLDLIQEGSLGLERGVEKFDPSRGYKFSTYAYWWIRQAITRAIAQQGRSIRLPIHITEKLNKIKKTQRELSQQLGRSATSAEIAVALELEPAQIRDYLTLSRQPISLDAKVGDRQDTELSELLEDGGISPEKYTVQQSLRQELQSTLDELTRQQREVINLRFGLEGGTELSLAKVGEILNLSRERVRQLEHQALSHFRRRHSSFRDYVAS